MAVKSHDDYNPANYACYAVTNVKEEFTLSTVHPDGLQEYLNYDTYDIGNKTLIAFTKANFSITDFVYRLVSQNYTEDIMYENYEFLIDVLNNSYNKSKSVFHIMHSQSGYHKALEGRPPFTDDSRRCDLDGYAAVAFYDTNHENATDVVSREYYNDNNIDGWTVYLSSMSNIYIVKIDFIELTDRAYKDWPVRIAMAETFPHAMRLAYEWSLLAQGPWNSTDTIAQKCKGAFDEWAIPEDVIQEIINGQSETSLSLYFKGDSNPGKSIKENAEVGPKFKNWFISKLRYRTLVSLTQNYPDRVEIPSSMVEKEKKFFEEEIYSFCVQNKLNLDTVTPIEIMEIAYHSGKYKERNNTITDIVKKNLYLNDLELIKEYERSIKEKHRVKRVKTS